LRETRILVCAGGLQGNCTSAYRELGRGGAAERCGNICGYFLYLTHRNAEIGFVHIYKTISPSTLLISPLVTFSVFQPPVILLPPYFPVRYDAFQKYSDECLKMQQDSKKSGLIKIVPKF
jgi:hypothetical protein